MITAGFVFLLFLVVGIIGSIIETNGKLISDVKSCVKNCTGVRDGLLVRSKKRNLSDSR